LLGSSHLAKTPGETFTGRFPGFRLDRSRSSHPFGTVAFDLLFSRRRLQWRVRGGFSPPSLSPAFPRAISLGLKLQPYETCMIEKISSLAMRVNRKWQNFFKKDMIGVNRTIALSLSYYSLEAYMTAHVGSFRRDGAGAHQKRTGIAPVLEYGAVRALLRAGKSMPKKWGLASGETCPAGKGNWIE